MKKTIFLFSLLLSCFAFAQQQTITYSVSPETFTENDNVTLTFDGASIDESVWAVSDNALYLWSWSYNLSFGDLQDCPTNGDWTNSNEANKLTYDSTTDTYSISFIPSTFYNRTGIGRIGFLIKAKSGDGDKKSQDILVDLQINQLTLTNPIQNTTIVDAGTSITISATTLFSSNFSLKANGNEIDTATNTTSYSFNYVVNEDTDFVLEANDGAQVLTKNFSARITSLFPVPDGLLDGINIDPTDNTKATLVLYAPGKETVHVIGDFNNWQIEASYLMYKDTARDRFWIELTGLTPQFDHMYQYIVDSDIRIADPYSTIILSESNDQFIDNVTYPNLPPYPTGSTNNAVTLLRTGDAPYNWQVTNFQKPEKTDLVIYELLIRDFDALHSFDAVKSRLDYIESLGANAIELMPVSEFDGNLSWGYNPSFHMALDKYYGTATAFKQLIDACHSRGIAVILDVVYNHASGQHPFYRMWNTDNGGFGGQATAENPFFNPTATHAYSVFNDFNHQSDATKQYVERTVKYWLEEYKIDGFRWDLTKGFTQNCGSNDEGCTNGLQQDRVDVLKEYADYQWDIDPDFYIIFEHLGGISEEKQWADYRAAEGKGILMWNKQTDPYSEATIADHTSGKSNIIGVSYKAKGFDGPSAVSYMESHDEQRIMYRNLNEGESNADYSVKDLNTALSRMEAAGAFFFSVPGPKMIWQFGELGYEVDINLNGRTGDKPIRWEYVDNPNRIAIYNTWSKLINLKLNAAIFKTDDFTIDADKTTGLKTIHLSLASATGDDIKYITIIGNFGVTEQDINPSFQETGTWYEILNGNTPYDVSNVSATIALAPGEFKMYSDKPYVNPEDLDSDGVLNADDLCANTPFGTVVDVNGCEVFSLPSNNFALQITNETCRTSNNGSIGVVAVQNLNYSITITGNGTTINDTFNSEFTINNLEAGDYSVCIGVDGQAGYEQCFHITITEPEDLSVLSKTSNNKTSLQLELSGSDLYTITLNDETFQTSQSSVHITLQAGSNMILVTGEKDCQGSYEEVVYSGIDMSVFPNPITNTVLNVYLGDLNSEKATIQMYSILGRQVYTHETNKNSLTIDTSNFSKGIYILNVKTKNEIRSFKIIKN